MLELNITAKNSTPDFNLLLDLSQICSSCEKSSGDQTEVNRGALQNEIHDYKQDQVYLEVNKVASMAEREEANARLVGDYNMESRYDQEKCDGLEREQGCKASMYLMFMFEVIGHLT